MGGRFSKDNRPLLPGAYFNVEAVQQEIVAPASGQTVALPIVHDWGPVTTPTLVTSFAQFEAIFGRSETPGRTAVRGAFLGENVPGWGGAGAVLVHRLAGASAAAASRTLNDTASTPATAVTITARYAGTRGNNLRVAVLDTAGASADTDLVIYDGTLEIERWTFVDADTQSIVDTLNANSQWVTATYQGPGPLALVTSPVALTGGNDGAGLLVGDWTDAMTALEIERFGLLAPYDLTDDAVLGPLVTWAKGLNAAGRRFRLVIGGGSADSPSLAVTRSAQIGAIIVNDPDVVNLGGFRVEFADGSVLTSSQLAPRYAGILAQRGEVHGATAARLGGAVRIVNGPSQSEKVAMFKGGAVGIGRDSDPVSPIRFEAAVTTYTTKTDPAVPYTIFRNPKFVATMQGVEMEITEYAESNIIGKTPINNKTRDSVKGEMLTRLLRRVEAQIIQPNPTVQIDSDPPPTDDDEFIALVYGIRFGRTAEQVFGTLRVA